MKKLIIVIINKKINKIYWIIKIIIIGSTGLQIDHYIWLKCDKY